MGATKVVQNAFAFSRRGGARKGAGRKSNGAHALVSRAARAEVSGKLPVLVTAKVLPGFASLRRVGERKALEHAFFSGKERFGFRLIHYSVQQDHVHLIAEAHDRRALARGLQGLFVRVARALNRLWNRVGRVFQDRFHSRVLATPREVRNALSYVLNNAKKHGVSLAVVDLFSSGRWFDGWLEGQPGKLGGEILPVVAAQSWLLRLGWRRHGRISLLEIPGQRARVAANRGRQDRVNERSMKRSTLGA